MKAFRIATALVLANLWLPVLAEAQSCYGHSNLSGECAKVIGVAAYGDADRRRTEEEFAREVGESVKVIHGRFAATGTLSCRGVGPCAQDPSKTCTGMVEGSAQVTANSGVITTAAHVLNVPENCKKVTAASNCTFSIEGDSNNQNIKVVSLLDQGFHCPTLPNDFDDWAVMKLSRPVKGVVPYRVDPARSLHVGDRVMSVCRSADFLRVGSGGVNYNPKHIANCTIKNVYPEYTEVNVPPRSDCAIAEMCSGGSVLSGNQDNPALLAIHVIQTESHDEQQSAVKNKTTNIRPYNESAWSTEEVPVSGKFLDAILKAAGLPPVPKALSIWDTAPNKSETGTSQK
jgi:hypothetical protein